MSPHALSWRDLSSSPIERDSTLQNAERETCFNLLGGESLFTVVSYRPSVIQGLLRQPEFEVEEAYTRRQGGREVIIGVKGRLPVACVHIGAARGVRYLSAMFSRRSTRPAGPGNCVPRTQNGLQESRRSGTAMETLPFALPGDTKPPDCVSGQ